MSRALLALALVLFVVAGLAPLLAMLPRIGADDVARLTDPRIVNLLGRTLLLGLGVAGLALAIGMPFGFLVARTDLPGAPLLRALGLAPLFLPTLLMAITWTAFVEWRGAWMTIWCLGLASFPLVAVFTARAFERVDRRLEEAARLAAGVRGVLRVDLPLVLPASLAGACLAFALAVNDFGVPDYVSSVGPKFNVYADEIFANWNQIQRPGLAVATALPLIALTLCTLVPVLALRRRGALASLGRRFEEPGRFALGAWRLPALAFVVGVIALAVVLPLGRLVYEAGGKELWTTRAFGEAMKSAIERARGDLLRSVLYGLGAALLAVGLGLVLGHAIERLRSRTAGRLLELACLLPLAAPATLFGIGVIVTWSRPETQDFYQSGWMPVLCHTGRLSVFAVLILSGAVASLPREHEEAAQLAGAGPVARLARIVAPPLWPSLAASGVLVFAFALRELDTAILVPAANRTAILRVYNGVHFSRDEYVAALSLLLVFLIVLPACLFALFSRRRLEVLP